MSKNTRGVIHLFIPLIIVVILVVIGFFIYRQTKQSSTTTTSPSTTADLTKNWVRHTTDKYLISFKYPPSLSIKETKSEDVEDSTVSKNIEMAFETVYFYSADNPETPLYTLGVYNPTNAELTPYGYYQEYLYLKGPCDLRWLDSDPFRAEQFHANGHAVLKIEIFEPAEHFSCYYVKDVDSNIIVLSTRNLKDAVEHGKINLQAKAILGTLQIEPYYLDKNHNWRLYKHQSFPLSFKYPQSWDLLNVLESTNRIVVNLSSEDLEKESGYFGGDWPTTYYYGGAKILVSIDKKNRLRNF